MYGVLKNVKVLEVNADKFYCQNRSLLRNYFSYTTNNYKGNIQNFQESLALVINADEFS